MVLSRRSATASFFVLFALLNAAALLVRNMDLDPARRGAITVGLGLDFALTVPIAYYFLVLRPRSGSWIPLALVAGLGCLRASMLVPEGAAVRPLIAGALEAGVLAAIIWRLRAGWKQADLDPVERIAAAVKGVLPAPAVRAVSMELAVFYYAFGRHRSRPGGRAFSIHEQGGAMPLLSMLAVISVVEAAVVHIVVQRWSTAAAWGLTALSLYGAVWLTGLARSFAACPLVVDAGGVLLRRGFLWRLRIPAGSIAEVRRSGEEADLGFAILSEGSVWIRLAAPLEAEGPCGIRREVRSVSVGPDDPEGFLAALRQGPCNLEV